MTYKKRARREYVKRPSSSRIFYHVTEKEYLPSIMRNGLKPQPQRWADDEQVNLWGTFKDAKKYAEEYGFDIILKVEMPPRVRVLKLPPDEKPHDTIVDYVPDFGDEYIVKETIPPERIKIACKRQKKTTRMEGKT